MEFKQALEKALSDKSMLERMGKGYYLSSAVCVVSQSKTLSWTLVFSFPGSADVLNVTVSDKVRIEKGVQNPQAGNLRLDVERVRTSSSEILEKARAAVKGYNQAVTKEIITLRQEDKPVWRVVCFTASLDVIIVEYDAFTGEKISEKTDSMIRSA